jgi:hypothetical protein
MPARMLLRSDFHAVDVLRKAFQRIRYGHVAFELVRGELGGLKQASNFVKGR